MSIGETEGTRWCRWEQQVLGEGGERRDTISCALQIACDGCNRELTN